MHSFHFQTKLISKSDKDMERKLLTLNEYRWKNSQKTLASQIQQYVKKKKKIYHD